MSSNRRIVIVDEDDDKKLNLSTRGLLDVLSVEIVDASGNQISSFGGSGGTSHADDAAFSIGSASSITPIGYLADEASPDSVDEGDVGVPRMTLTRKPYAVISNPTGEINATVLDYTNSNPVAVRLSDANGDYVAAGAGTQYTEDAAAAADPVGGTIMMTRDDQLSTVTEAAGDWSRARGTSKGALWVALADASGDPITSFGGGTQYTEADTDATITGTAMMWEDGSDTLRAVSASKPLPVEVTDASIAVTGTFWQATQPVSGTFYQATQPVSGTFWQATQPISGTVTANAGTNLNTSALLTETIFTGRVGEVQATPTANTVLARLKTIADNQLADGHNVTVDNASLAVTGTFYQATQPVSIAGTVTVDLAGNNDVSLNTGANKVGDVGLLGNTVANGSGSDYHALIDSAGHLQIDVVSAPSTAVTGTFWQATQPVSGTFWQATQPISGTVTANLSATDNAVLDTIDAVLDTINAKLVSGTDIGDVTINNAAGAAAVNIQDGGNAITVDGTITANLSATDNGVLDQIELNTDPLLVVGGGTEATAIRVTIANNSTGVLSVDDNGGALTVDGTVTANLSATDNAVLDTIDAVLDTIKIDTEAIETAVEGTLTVDLGANNDVTVTSGTIDVLGNVAHDAADSGDPVKIGHKAVLFNSSAPPNTAAAENDRVNSIADEYGRQYVETTHPNYWDVSADYAGAQTNTSVKATPGAGLSLYLTDIIISNGATAGNITLLDGSGGTVLFEIYPAINGGASTNLRTPIKLTANTLLAITSTSCSTHAVTVSGFIAP